MLKQNPYQILNKLPTIIGASVLGYGEIANRSEPQSASDNGELRSKFLLLPKNSVLRLGGAVRKTEFNKNFWNSQTLGMTLDCFATFAKKKTSRTVNQIFS
jgi:hypothetical protein